jgi:hypothetical protein
LSPKPFLHGTLVVVAGVRFTSDSHTPIKRALLQLYLFLTTFHVVVAGAGFEPTTYGL